MLMPFEKVCSLMFEGEVGLKKKAVKTGPPHPHFVDIKAVDAMRRRSTCDSHSSARCF